MDAGSDAEDLDAALPNATINGKVAYTYFDHPVVGATVTIAGKTATTDATGAFSIADVARPYDLRVTYTEDAVQQTFIAQGVRRADPNVEVSSYWSVPMKLATVTGTVAGITLPLPADERVRVVAAGMGGGTLGATPDPTTGAFTLSSVSWRGAATTKKNIYAVHYKLNADDTVKVVDKVAKVTLDLTDGGTIPAGTVTLAAPAASIATMTVAATLPTYSDPEAFLGISFEPACAIELPLGTNLGSPLSLSFPAATNGISAYAFVGGGFTEGGYVFAVKSPVVDQQNFTIDTGAPLSPTPASGAVFTPATTFAWTAFATGPYTFRAYDATSHAVLTIVTRASSVTWPADILPAAGSYEWLVRRNYDPFRTVDDILVDHGITALVPSTTAPRRTFTVP